MLTVGKDAVQVERRLAAGLLGCPGCGGRLGPWGHARLRVLRPARFIEPDEVIFNENTRRFDSAQQEAFLNLWRTYDRLRMLEDQLFSQHDLTAQQYNALRLLKAEHPGTLPTLVLAGGLDMTSRPELGRAVQIDHPVGGSADATTQPTTARPGYADERPV